MKKIFLTMSLAIVAMNLNAQLVVDSLGKVGIGTQTPKSMLAVGTSGDIYTGMYCDGSGNNYGVHFKNFSNSMSEVCGGQFSVKNTIGTITGERCVALGGSDSNTIQIAVGLEGCAGYSYTSIGLLGAKWLPSSNPTNFAGVYGSETFDISPSFTNYSGTYAGYFNGKVRVTNGIYATVLSPSATPSGQNGTTILSDRGESVTDKLSQVQAVQFLRYDPTQEVNVTRASLEDIDIDNMSPKELDSLRRTMPEEEPERYLSPVQYGLDANQLKAVYPELVYEDANGNVSINYVEMVPLLVQCINELSAKVAELEGTSPRGAKAPTNATDIEKSVADVDMVRMDQNKPNPFSESTVITLNIPSNAQVANIFIYDMSGKQVQSLPVSERGETNITVYAADLAAGMYIYTLVVDGKVAVTRRMIVSNV